MPTEYVETSGTGSVTVVPDVVVLNLRLVHVAPDVAGALDGCATSARDALAALDAATGESTARQTGRIDVSEHWSHQRQASDGYEATQSLAVRLRETARVGAVIAAVADATGAAFRMDGLSWGSSDTTAARAEARDLAFADARAKALQLATLGGRALGAVVRLVEHDADRGGVPVLRAMRAEAAVAMPAEPGEGTIEVTVAARWLLAG